MQNAVIIYYLLFFEKYLLLNGLGYGYCISFICEEAASSRENVDIFVSRILQPRVNDPLFRYYFKPLKKIKNGHYFSL